MLFTSWDFFVFFLAILICYQLSPDRYKASIMLCGSYLFYGWWNWLYVPLLLFSTTVDFLVAKKIYALKSHRKRKFCLLFSIFINLFLLGYFKYYNFFLTNINELIGVEFALHNLILPIGISFYTFQTISYSVDVYQGKIKPQTNFKQFALYVSFFPQLIAGPIERASNLLPQLKSLKKASTEQIKKGLLLVSWGVFLKLVLADNLTNFVTNIFYGQSSFHAYIYFLAAFVFLIKLYADFMSYSEIARGISLFWGVNLSINFKRPFLARSLREFWQRWHITLTSWIGDYINKPLKERIKNTHLRKLIVVLVMTLVGIWHGAGWNFILYGFVQGVILWLWYPIANFIKSLVKIPPIINDFFGWLFMMLSVALVAPMFFITEWHVLITLIDNLFATQTVGLARTDGYIELTYALFAFLLLLTVSINDEFSYKSCYKKLLSQNNTLLSTVIISLVTLTLLMGNLHGEEFIYFAF